MDNQENHEMSKTPYENRKPNEKLKISHKHLMGKKIFYEKQKFDDLCAHYHHDPKKNYFQA